MVVNFWGWIHEALLRQDASYVVGKQNLLLKKNDLGFNLT